MKNDSKSLTLSSGSEGSPTTVETPWTDADALALVPDDVKSNLKSYANILGTIDVDGEDNVRQLVPKLIHDYHDLANMLDEAEERDALHYEKWRETDTDYWLYRYIRHLSCIIDAATQIAYAVDDLRDMFKSLDIVDHYKPDCIEIGYAAIGEIERKAGDVEKLARHLTSYTSTACGIA